MTGREDRGPTEVGERFEELFLSPRKDSRPSAVRIGSLVFVPSIEPSPREQPSADQTAEQLREVLTEMDEVLGLAGASRADVVRATFFLREVTERPTLNTVWATFFPDASARPPHKYVPAALQPGVNVALQVIALPGPARRTLEIPGVVHSDPMSMGQRAGTVITSSRVFGAADDVESTLELLWQRVAVLFDQAGSDLDDLQQATFFVGDASIADSVERWWHEAAPRGSFGSAFHLVEVNLGGGNGFPRVEVIGIAHQATAG